MRKAASLACAGFLFVAAAFCGHAALPVLGEPGGICTAIVSPPTPNPAYEPILPQCTSARHLVVDAGSGFPTPVPQPTDTAGIPYVHPTGGPFPISASTTLPVSLATLPPLSAGAAVIGAVTQSGTWNIGSITTLPALPAGTNTIGNVNQTTGTAGYDFLLDSGGTNKLSISVPGAALTALGKTATILTSASATACTSIQATAGTLVELVNVGSATTVFPAFYNDAGTTCATGTRVYGNFTSLTLQAGQAINLNIPLSAGLAYKLSGALSDNLVVVTN